MKIYFIEDNKEVILTNHFPFSHIGNMPYPLDSIRKKANIDPYNKSNLIKWNDFSWNQSHFYAQPIGSIILDLLELDFDNFDDFKKLVYHYGIDCLKENLQEFIYKIVTADKDGKTKKISEKSTNEIFERLYKLNIDHLKEVQYKFQKAVEECLFGDDSTFMGKNITPKQRYIFYNLCANVLGNMNANGEKDVGMYYNQPVSNDGEARLMTYEKGSIEKYATNITEECFLSSDYTWEQSKNNVSDINLSDIKVESIDGYAVNDIGTACYLEFKRMLNSNTIFRYCKHCDRLFVVSENKRSVYCDRILEGQKEPCNVIGPRKAYYENLKDKPIESTYRNAYKTHYARIRSAKDKRKAKADFIDWADMAKAKKNEALKGTISEDEFLKWIKGEKESE